MNIDLSQLTGKLLEIAKLADSKSEKPNGVYLDNNQEISLFMQEADKSVKSGEVKESDISAIFGLQRSSSLNKTASEDEEIESAYLKLSQEEKELVTNKTREKTTGNLCYTNGKLKGGDNLLSFIGALHGETYSNANYSAMIVLDASNQRLKKYLEEAK